MAASATPLGRIAAFFIDYAVIAAYLAALTGAAFALGFVSVGAPPENRIVAHATAFAVVTAPVVVGFAFLESSAWQATLGKRLLSLRVASVEGRRVAFAASLLRNALKFLPWEIAHAGIWHMPGRPFVDEPGLLSLIAWTISLTVAAIYVAMLFTDRTPYDRIAGTIVCLRTPRA